MSGSGRVYALEADGERAKQAHRFLSTQRSHVCSTSHVSATLMTAAVADRVATNMQHRYMRQSDGMYAVTTPGNSRDMQQAFVVPSPAAARQCRSQVWHACCCTSVHATRQCLTSPLQTPLNQKALSCGQVDKRHLPCFYKQKHASQLVAATDCSHNPKPNQSSTVEAYAAHPSHLLSESRQCEPKVAFRFTRKGHNQ